MKKPDPTAKEQYVGHWLEVMGEAMKLGKKILCCPSQQRVELLEAVNDTAQTFQDASD